MNRNLSWKVFVVFAVLFWSVWEQTPWNGKNLIDAFEEQAVEKDETFNEIVATAREAAAAEPELEFAHLFNAVGDQDISKYFPDIEVSGLKSERNRTILTRVQRRVAGKMKLGLDLQGGMSFLVEMKLDDIEGADQLERRQSALTAGIEVLRKRLDRFGVAEPIIVSEGGNRIRINMPGLGEADRDQVRATIQTAAHLELRMVHEDNASLLAQGITAWPGYELLEMENEDEFGKKTVTPYLVNKKSEEGLTGKYITRAYVLPDNLGRPEVHFELDSEGAGKFGRITQNNPGRLMGIVLDGVLYSAPSIDEPILGGRAYISGTDSATEAYGLANALENPLEAEVEIVDEQGVDPSLGADSIKSGFRATLIGLLAVAVFMVVYYMFAGLIANCALALNIVILLGVFCSMDATLTLPGIAGVLLTIGMAVDANVLIFERIREELGNGKSLKGAVTGGYGKAFSTIIDANITTLIASSILIYLGTGPVKGFGVTLSIGIIVSMFTALFATRIIFDALLNRGLAKVNMMSLVSGTKIRFLDWSKPAFYASWALVLVGFAYAVFGRGSDLLGVDLKGGDTIVYSFDVDNRVDVDQIRDAIDDAAEGGALIQYQRGGGDERLSVTSKYETGSAVEDALKAAFPQAGFEKLDVRSSGAAVSGEVLRTALVALLMSLFGILVYVAFRYEFSFAIGAVVAVLHDVLMTFGIFALAGREISAPMIAAVLTIVGFSINDTIVIFDRIREYLKMGMSGSFHEVMNYSLNQTLARTLITSGTLLLATLSLLFFGGGVINDFAFTLTVGVLTGTYSSIYIAGSLVLWWHKGHKPKIATGTTVVIGPDAQAETA